LLIITNFRGMKRKSDKKLTYDEKIAKCEEFLKTFEDYDIS
jgi:hypothetical protein